MSSEPKFLLYCHNVFGLGHVVRSLHIARALLRQGRCQIRLVTGCRFLDRLRVPPQIDVVPLPPLRSTESGRLQPVGGGSAGRTLQDRSRRIEAEIQRFRPQVVLVDHNPLGLLGELARTLDGESTARFVWGVRDIWGKPGYLETRGWLAEGPEAATSRMHRFHTALAFTDSSWIDTFSLLTRHTLPRNLRSVGFVTAPDGPPEHGAATDPDGDRRTDGRAAPLVVALFGGGTAARALAELLMQALGERLARNHLRLRLVVGPFSPGVDAIREVVGTEVEIWAEGSAESSSRDAEIVVCRAGYNTAYSIVRSNKPVVFVPMAAEDGEQIMRAERLAELDGVESVPEGSPGTAERLRRAVVGSLERGPVQRRLPFATNGAEQAARELFAIAHEGAA